MKGDKTEADALIHELLQTWPINTKNLTIDRLNREMSIYNRLKKEFHWDAIAMIPTGLAERKNK